ncbi:MAG: ligase-associated DNA damage response DEXH box helicase [Verrucomicrobiota bacterium]
MYIHGHVTQVAPGEKLIEWFNTRGWTVFPFQREVWRAFRAGQSGLLHCSTGAGKTLAIWFAALLEAMETQDEGGGLRVLWITPLRALAADTEATLASTAAELWPAWRVARRTGDSSAYMRRKIAERPPEALVTTPESATLLLSQPQFLRHFRSLRLVVMDEWHELISTKRGVLAELALARFRALAPRVRVWGLSATLGRLEEAALALGGYDSAAAPRAMQIIQGGAPKRTRIETLLPPEERGYPWGGHLGLHLIGGVADVLRRHASSILFTNTRSQAELWLQGLVEAMPDWANQIGLHHGSLSNEVRAEAEEGLRTGRLRAVVATSSLDLGVDFAPVEAVLQVGSPKGVSRLLQRAGRSGHRPGIESVVYCVPTHMLELVEIAAARDLALAGKIEGRTSLRCPLDLLCQHLATVASGGMDETGGFEATHLQSEVCSTLAYHQLTEAEFAWALDFTARGGQSLTAYPQFARLVQKGPRFSIRDDRTAKDHRMNIGTITSDASIQVQFLSGGSLGSVEESFLAKMRRGDRFLFAGRNLELVRVRDLKAYVRLARAGPRGVPRWMGGRMPLSTCLADGMRARLDAARRGIFDSIEMERLRGVLRIQSTLSIIPALDELLVERWKSREGHHLFIYPFEGRLVHEGLAALFAYRLARRQPGTFSLAFNDHGMELLSVETTPLEEAIAAGLFREENLIEDILGSINAAEISRRQFREIARVAGLTQEGVGRARKSVRQLIVSASLLYEVFQRYEPSNLLFQQATREVLDNQLEQTRLRAALVKMQASRLRVVDLEAPSPFAFPIFVERFRQQLSSEELASRVARMEIIIEKAGQEKARSRRKNADG